MWGKLWRYYIREIRVYKLHFIWWYEDDFGIICAGNPPPVNDGFLAQTGNWKYTEIWCLFSSLVHFRINCRNADAMRCLKDYMTSPKYDAVATLAQVTCAHAIIKCGMKLLIHSKTSTVQPLKFRNGQVISSHTLLEKWLFIHAGI